MSLDIPQDSATRLNYHDGMFLTSALMTTEQSYFDNLSRLQNQMVYNPGVLEGLKPLNQNNQVLVEPGGGIDIAGHFLLFPGQSDNAISVPAKTATPCAVYLHYPQAPFQGQQESEVNMAATLVIADVGRDNGPDNSIIIAHVSHDNGTITDVVDKRVPVTSKLPAKFNRSGGHQSVEMAEALNKTLHGTRGIAREGLGKHRLSKSFEIYFLPGQGAAFTTAPKVIVTPQLVLNDQEVEANDAGGSLSAVVTKVGTCSFNVTLTTRQVVPNSVTSVDLNWMAFADGA